MNKTRVGVLRGGASSEYEVSLKSGEAVLKNLPDKYEGVDVFIDKNGNWHIHGILHKKNDAIKKFDVALNVLHGEYGENGQVQDFLDQFGVNYTGAKSFSSRLSMNKALTKSFVEKVGVKTPRSTLLSRDDYRPDVAIKIFKEFPLPAVIKPLALGSSVGVSIAKDFFSLEEALKMAFESSDQIMIEEFIQGKEATCGVVEGFRGEDYYVLPPIEIVPKSTAGFFDYKAKYQGQSEEICPGRFSEAENAELRRLSALVHKTIGLRHYSRSDFIIHPKRGIYFLEINNAAGVGLTEASLLPKALRASDSTLSEFLDHIIGLSRGGK